MSVDGEQRHVAIPMGEVSDVSTQEVNLLRTAGAGYLTVLAALGIALAVISVSILAVK
jgi:hypothetical protein